MKTIHNFNNAYPLSWAEPPSTFLRLLTNFSASGNFRFRVGRTISTCNEINFGQNSRWLVAPICAKCTDVVVLDYLHSMPVIASWSAAVFLMWNACKRVFLYRNMTRMVPVWSISTSSFASCKTQDFCAPARKPWLCFRTWILMGRALLILLSSSHGGKSHLQCFDSGYPRRCLLCPTERNFISCFCLSGQNGNFDCLIS